jgi:uncharacterized OB-fold protein
VSPHGLRVSRCGHCGWQGFPVRLWCPGCGVDTEEALVHAGVVEDETLVHHAVGRELAGPVRIGTVALEGGGRALARLVDVAAGVRVDLTTGGGVPVATPSPSGA